MSDTSEEKSALEKLTGKQRLFVECYIGISNGNATDAARRAGYASPNVEGSRLLVNASIRTAVSERYAQAAMTADEALARIASIARASFADALEAVPVVETDKDGLPLMYDAETGEGLPSRIIQRVSLERLVESGVIHQVSEISHNEYGPKIKLSDAQSALDKIARAHGLYKDAGNAASVVVKMYGGVNMTEEV